MARLVIIFLVSVTTLHCSSAQFTKDDKSKNSSSNEKSNKASLEQNSADQQGQEQGLQKELPRVYIPEEHESEIGNENFYEGANIANDTTAAYLNIPGEPSVTPSSKSVGLDFDGDTTREILSTVILEMSYSRSLTEQEKSRTGVFYKVIYNNIYHLGFIPSSKITWYEDSFEFQIKGKGQYQLGTLSVSQVEEVSISFPADKQTINSASLAGGGFNFLGSGIAIDGEVTLLQSNNAVYFMHYSPGPGWVQKKVVAIENVWSPENRVALKNGLAIFSSRGKESTGTVLTFFQKDSSWIAGEVLTAPNPIEGQVFGNSIVTDGQFLVVGNRAQKEANDQAKSIYIYERNRQNWDIVFENSISANGSTMGHKVQLDGNFASTIELIDSNKVPENFPRFFVHIYEKKQPGWQLHSSLNVSDPNLTLFEGGVHSLDGNKLAVAALKGRTNVVVIFEYDPLTGKWSETEIVPILSEGFRRISDLQLDGDRFVVGFGEAHFYQEDKPIEFAGAVALYKNTKEGWKIALGGPIFSDEPKQMGNFGERVKIYRNYIVVGAVLDSKEEGNPYQGNVVFIDLNRYRN